jgi:hypothetical protein
MLVIKGRDGGDKIAVKELEARADCDFINNSLSVPTKPGFLQTFFLN